MVITKELLEIKNNNLYLKGTKLKKGTVIEFTCEICGNYIKQKFFRNKRFFNKELTCNLCSRKQTSLKKYGKEYPVQSSIIKTKISNSNSFKNRLDGNEIVKKRKATKLKKYGNKNYNNNEKAKQTKFYKYGDENYYNIEKYKHTCLKKYGVEFAPQSDEIKKKIKKTNLNKYNKTTTFNYNLIKEIKLKKYGDKYYNNNKKAKQTCLKRYGVDNPQKVNNIKEKIKRNNYIKYYNYLLNSDRLRDKVKPLFIIEDYNGSKSKYQWECLKCNNVFFDNIADGKVPRCPICYPITKSKGEKEIVEWLYGFNKQVIENSKEIISPYEIDIYLPLKKLAIEFNGLYYHSTKFITDKWYHQKKVELCFRKGIRLLHIWEDEWLEKKDEIKQKISYYLSNKNIFINIRKPRLFIIKSFNIWY